MSSVIRWAQRCWSVPQSASSISGPAAFSEDGLSLLTPAEVQCPDASLDLVNELCGLTQDEIGREFGVTGYAVSQALRRAGQLRAESRKLDKTGRRRP